MQILSVLLIIHPLGEFSVSASHGWKPCFLACECKFCFCSILQLPVGIFRYKQTKHCITVCSPYPDVCSFRVCLEEQNIQMTSLENNS